MKNISQIMTKEINEEKDKYKESFIRFVTLLENRINEYIINTPQVKDSRIKEEYQNLKIEKQLSAYTEIFWIVLITLLKEIERYNVEELSEQAFTSFAILSIILNVARKAEDFSDEDCMNTIIYLIKQNSYLLKKQYKNPKIKAHPVEKKILSYCNQLQDLNTTPAMDLIVFIKNKNFISEFPHSIKIIEEFYIKKENYTKEDIEEIKASLINLQIHSEIVELFYKSLLKKVYKRKGIQTKNTNSKIERKAIEVYPYDKIKITPYSTPCQIEEKPIEISPFTKVEIIPTEKKKKVLKTAKKIIEELKKYIDIYDFHPKKDISPIEKIYIAKLLSSIDKTETEIITFLTLVDNKTLSNIKDYNLQKLKHLFLESKDKYYYYYEIKGRIELGNSLQFIEEGFELLNDDLKDEFREELISEIKQEIIALENSIPATYEYEFRKLEKQKQKKKY